MNGDPAVEPELDTFSLILPLPYRVAVILVLGVWAWAVNLHYLAILKIDVAGLIRYSNRATIAGSSHHLRSYRLAALISIPLIISLLLFWSITHGQASLVLAWEILPQSYLVLLALVFVLPLQRLSKAGRYRFLTILKRVSIGGIADAQDGKFGDILLADVLTSYAKVLGDLFVAECMLFSRKYSSTAKPDRGCGGAYLVPIIISIPSLIRLRQCLIEFVRIRKSMKQPGGSIPTGWGGQHLANALKYSSAFPVIFLSALQRGYDPNKIGMSEAGLFRLWLFFVFLNSFYSFYWDVAKDWDLTMFSSTRERNNPEHPWGLRRHTHFHTKGMYYGAIAVDLMLRCTWSLKLSPHLDHFNDLEGGIFIMEFLEVLRRWMWIFFRVETEWVRVNRGPPSDDILLVDYAIDNNKLDFD
ncbi:protein-ER retention protein [Xylographa carneopallida]|nr:protein-ER retention protein [Xylographa carneopallida]